MGAPRVQKIPYIERHTLSYFFQTRVIESLARQQDGRAMKPAEPGRAITCVTLLCLVSFSPSLFAADPSNAQDPSTPTAVPDYMTRWEFGVDVNEDRGPRFFIDPIVPLYRPADGAWMLGGNMFYDYESQYAHSRVGWGLEALSAYAEARSNMYLPTSGERTVEEGAEGTRRERAIPGFDFELGAPVPYYSRLKVFGGYHWYALPDFKNRYGWTMRMEYTPLPFLVMDGTVRNDTKTNVDWGLKVAFRIPLGGNLESVRSPLRFDASMFPESNVSDRLFDLVERHHDIILQHSITTPEGLTIEAARGGS